MTKRIVYTRPNGGLSVIIPTGEIPLEDVLKKDVPSDAVNVRVVNETEIPADRTFRNAWHDNNGIKVDMPKAREIHKEKLRALRAPKLAALDVEYQRADEAGDTKAKSAVAAKKQALRDVTADPRIAAAKTPDELKAVIPDALI